MTQTTSPAMHTLAVAKIKAGENVRDLDQDHVDALAASIELIGLITPVTVASDGDGGYNLVAGFHRFAAATKAAESQGSNLVALQGGEGANAEADQPSPNNRMEGGAA